MAKGGGEAVEEATKKQKGRRHTSAKVQTDANIHMNPPASAIAFPSWVSRLTSFSTARSLSSSTVY